MVKTAQDSTLQYVFCRCLWAKIS